VHPALLRISILPPGTFGDFHFTARHYKGFPLYHPLDDALTTIENQNFGAGVT